MILTLILKEKHISASNISVVSAVTDAPSTLCKMNAEDKLEGMLLKCSGGGMDGGGRVGLSSAGGLVVMTLGDRSLANHPLLAEDDDDEGEDENLTVSSLVTHDLVPPEQLMMQEEMTKNGGGEEDGGAEVGVHFPLKLTHKFPCLLHIPVSSHWFRSGLLYGKNLCSGPIQQAHAVGLIHETLVKRCVDCSPNLLWIHKRCGKLSSEGKYVCSS